MPGLYRMADASVSVSLRSGPGDHEAPGPEQAHWRGPCRPGRQTRQRGRVCGPREVGRGSGPGSAPGAGVAISLARPDDGFAQRRTRSPTPVGRSRRVRAAEGDAADNLCVRVQSEVARTTVACCWHCLGNGRVVVGLRRQQLAIQPPTSTSAKSPRLGGAVTTRTCGASKTSKLRRLCAADDSRSPRATPTASQI